MFLSYKLYGTLALLGMTQHLVLAFVDEENNKAESSAKMILNHLQVSWLKGLDWLARSHNSSDLNEIKAWIRSVESGETWALKILDNVLKRQREISSRQVSDIGILNHCDTVNVEYNDNDFWDDQRSDSQIDIISDMTEELDHSMCHQRNPQTQTTKSEFREREASKDFTTGEVITILVFFAIGAFMFVCTICDAINRWTSRISSTTMRSLAKFSLYTNACILLSTKVATDEMRAIHGLRFLSCGMVMTGHHYSLTVVLLKDDFNVLNLLEWKNSWLAVYITTTLFAVDTFFLISGFLTTYLFLKAKRSGIKVNLLMIYLQRYLRLTPCLGILMLFIVNLFHRVGSSPLWKSSLPPVVEACRQHWWVNLLYIQNIANNDALCLPHSWYLAIDMQLFWMSPIILYPLHRWPKIGLRILGFFLIGSVCTSTVLLVVNGYTNALVRLDVDFSRVLENFGHYYISTFNRPFPFFLGILLGYDVAVRRRYLTKEIVAINWVVAFGLALFCVWANYKVHNSNFAYNLSTEFLLAALLRPSWSIAIAWLIFACTQGYGGIATRFLSAPLFVPLSRISYPLYLIHQLVQGFVITSSEVPTTFSGFEITYGIFAEMILSITLAITCSLFIESPVNVLVKMVTNRGHQSKPATVVQQLHKYGKVSIQE